MSRRQRGNRDHGGLVPGLIMMALGAAFLLERFDMISRRQIWSLWPLAVIAVGLVKLLRPEGRSRSIFWLLIGIWLQVSTLELFGLGFDDSWPLLIIFVGAALVFEALVSGGDARPPAMRARVGQPAVPSGQPAASRGSMDLSEQAARGAGDEQ